MNQKLSARALARVFLRNGAFTFGGGDATTASLQRELVTHHNWLSKHQFGVCYAVSRLTPGTNLLAFCTAVGWTLLGLRGALWALLLASIPGAAVLMLMTGFYGAATGNPWLMSAIHAALAAAVGIMLAAVWALLRGPLRRSPARTVLVALPALLLSLHGVLSPLQVLALAAGFGLVAPERGAA
ncbi:MAG TPA: chromate transporter [Burkholderiales bacterium]|nr:chromate transporter [Burkholderiales bacterium]